jgi:hypothetical protein
MRRRLAIAAVALAVLANSPGTSLEATAPAPASVAPVELSSVRVPDRVVGGAAAREVLSMTKVERSTGDDAIGETAFFYPAGPAAIASALEQRSGARGIAGTSATELTVSNALEEEVIHHGDLSHIETGQIPGKGVGELRAFRGAVRFRRANVAGSLLGRVLGAEALARIVAAGPDHDRITYELSSQDIGATKVFRLSLEPGSVFQKLEVRVRVDMGGPTGTLVTVKMAARHVLSDGAVVKRLVQAMPLFIDAAMTAAAAAAVP